LADARSLSLVTGGSAYLLLPLEATYEAAGNDLDSSLIAVLLERLPAHETMHRHSVAEALAALADGEAQAAFLLRPATVAQIEEWAAARKQMPPKTTYFSPKPRTGMVFRSLEL
jgi:ABC-type amino acid transport substrate-binding protein